MCHCRDCQKAHGSAYFPAMMFLAGDFQVRGNPRQFTVTADSGTGITRNFCGNCGTMLYISTARYPDIRVVAAGTLDDPSVYAPKAHAWAGSEWDWAKVDDGLARFPGQPGKT